MIKQILKTLTDLIFNNPKNLSSTNSVNVPSPPIGFKPRSSGSYFFTSNKS